MRRAILLAAGSFEDTRLTPLRFAAKDAARLASVLTDKDLAGFDDVQVFADSRVSEARIALEQLARASDPGDLLLFYFSGHGKLDRDGTLALMMADSNIDVLGATALLSDELKRLFNLSRASQKVMILDCCYSGAAGAAGFKGMEGDAIDTLAQSFRGSFLLTASQRFERAWEVEEREAGALTDAFVRGIATGAASGTASDEITLSEIAAYVKRSVPTTSPQLPEYWDNGGIGGVRISRKLARFDASWTKRARQLVSRYARLNIFDDDFADSIRVAIDRRGRGPDPRLLLLNRLMTRQIALSTFVLRWHDGAAPATFTPRSPDERVGLDKESSVDAANASSGGPPHSPPPPAPAEPAPVVAEGDPQEPAVPPFPHPRKARRTAAVVLTIFGLVVALILFSSYLQNRHERDTVNATTTVDSNAADNATTTVNAADNLAMEAMNTLNTSVAEQPNTANVQSPPIVRRHRSPAYTGNTTYTTTNTTGM